MLFAAGFSGQPGVREVGAIGLTVNSLERVLPFYTNVLTFAVQSVSEASGKEQDALLAGRQRNAAAD